MPWIFARDAAADDRVRPGSANAPHCTAIAPVLAA